jgi:signal transduction histidine kinase
VNYVHGVARLMSTANFMNSEAVARPSDPSRQSHYAHHAGHVVQFYSNDVFLLESLSSFFGPVLRAGGSAIVIATEAHRQGLEQQLKTEGLDRSFAQGRFIALDAEETLAKFMVNGLPDKQRFEETVGAALTGLANAGSGDRSHLAAFGEMVAILWGQGKVEAAVRLEELWNGLANTHSFHLRCAYPMRHFDREEYGDSFEKICAVHSGVIPEENYSSLGNDDDRDRTIASLQQKAYSLAREVAERKRVEDELKRNKADLESLVEQRTVALRKLSARLLTQQDSERRRIARELHDCLGQHLIGLKLNVELLRTLPEKKELWVESEELMQQCLGEVRALSYLLHPPTMDAAGLVSAAQWFIDGFGQHSGIKTTFTAPENLGRLPEEVELTLFRALQEGLTNTHRHSEGTAAEVVINRADGAVVLVVKDNGCGIKQDVLQRFKQSGTGLGVGLTGIGERARDLGGSFQLDSDSSGTTVRVGIPVSSAMN